MRTSKILIVDDQIDNIRAIKNALLESKNTYLLLQALNGELAIRIALAEIPDIIITDWEMPGMNGVQLIRHLKADGRTADIPVIMCTGVMTTSENLETALEAGAVDYIRKPVDKIELLARLASTLKLAESYQEIKKLNEGKDKIYSIIAHDLRGPVGTVELLIQLLIEKDVDKNTGLNLLFKAKIAIHSTYNLLENLLMWAKSQRNKIEVRSQKIHLFEVLENTIELISEQALVKSISIQNLVGMDQYVYADSNMMATILRNLIGNAIKFTPRKGQIKVVAFQVDQMLQIMISDTGIGIIESKLSRLFENNYYTTNGTEGETGTGLGLLICKEFINKQGGEIWAESEVNKGTIFIFTLPFVV